MASVVIIGAGFAGLEAARALGHDRKVELTVIDRRNHHLFQPLLYQVAIAGLSAPDIAAPIRRVLRDNANTRVLLAEVLGIDLSRKSVRLADQEIRYDFLIVAAGASHSYFGHPEWERDAPGLKSIGDALEIRRRVLSAFENAERVQDPKERAAWLTFLVVGGGPTGVELAGSLGELARYTLRREFRSYDPETTKVLLLEGGDRILPSFPPALSKKAASQLERLGVQVRTKSQVTKIDDRGAEVGGERIESRTVLWAAGVQASPIARSLGVPLDRAGRVLVDRDLTVPGHPEVFVVGDLAHVEQDTKLVPGVAPAAMQGGRLAAKNIRRAIAGEPALPFRYVDKGSLATIGRRRAVADVFGLHLSGFIAWWTWLFIHILYLIGFRNRFIVMFEWAWAYVTYQKTARVIIEEPEPPPGPAPPRHEAPPIAEKPKEAKEHVLSGSRG
jgi:NADH dehydrogenase